MLEYLYRFVGDRDPVVVVLTAIAMMVTGGLVIVHPPLVAWVLGLGLLLAGVAVIVATIAGRRHTMG